MKLYRSDNQDPAWNLAAEEWLFQSGQDALFLYVNRPAVVLGCYQQASCEVDRDYCRQHDIAVLRRISGGGTVYHDQGNLNFCFVGPRQASPLSADFLLPIVEILQGFGIQASIGQRKDLWIAGGKISGTASHFSKDRSLQHGTLLFDSNLEGLHAALGLERLSDGGVRPNLTHTSPKLRAVASQPSPVRNLRPFLAKDMDSLAFFDSFAQASSQYFSIGCGCFAPDEEMSIEALAMQKYRQASWNLKR